ncbi:MAG: S-layer homology domain-containing protein [Oscillospiraceae bacterium]|nr:S-layer homology domain-containing protein [Oscillospiraceae bacterium]
MKKVLSFVLIFAFFAGMLPQVTLNASAESNSVTYTFTYTARPDAARATTLEASDGTWNSVYKNFPANPTSPGENWAYLGTGTGRAISGNAYVQIAGYVKTNKYAADDWTAFKIKVPESGIYKLSAATGYAYANASPDLGIYIVPLDETYSAIFAEGNTDTYGTISGQYRSGYKSFSALGIPESAKIGFTTSLYSKTATNNAALSLSDTNGCELEAGKEYALIWRTTSIGAQTLTSLTFTYEVKSEEKLTAIEASFDDVIVGSRLNADVIWKCGDKEIENASGQVSLEIEEDKNGVLISDGSGGIYAKAAGTAKLKVTGTLDGISASVSVPITVTGGEAYSGKDVQYLFYQNAYEGFSSVGFTASEVNEETFANGCTCLDYGETRPWAFVAAKASRPDKSGMFFKLYAKYLDLSGKIGEWAAFKVKVPAPGKYIMDVGGYTYASGGKANIYMVPYEEDMTFSVISENIDKYTAGENLVASADFNGSATDSVVQKAVGSFVADENLDYTKGYTDYLMVVTTNRSDIKTSAYYVLLHSINLVGSGGIDKVDVDVSDTEIGVGEEIVVESVTATYPNGGNFNLDEAFIRHSVTDESLEILRVSDDGKTFKALKEGTATIETLVLVEGSVATKKTEITVSAESAVMNAFLYGPDTALTGDTLSFETRIELNNRKIINGGEVTKYEIVSESDEGVLALTENGKTVVAQKAGTADIRAEVNIRGKILYTDTISIAILKEALSYDAYPVDFSIDLRQGTYSGDGYSTLQEITEYSEYRNWIYHDFVNPNPQYKIIELPAKTAKYSFILWSSATANGYLAFKVIFPTSGRYVAESYGYCRDRTPNLEMYVIPATKENDADLENLLVKDNKFYAGSAEHYRNTGIYFETNAFDGSANITEAGEYFVVFKCVPGTAYSLNQAYGEAWYNLSVNFKNTSVVSSAKLVAENGKEKIDVGEDISLGTEFFDADGNELEIDPSLVRAVYSSENESVATVDENGKVTGISDGKAVIFAKLSVGKATVNASLELRVEDVSGIDADAGIRASAEKSEIFTYDSTKLTLHATMNSGAVAEIPQEYITWTIVNGSEFADVSEDGVITGKAIGTVVVRAKVDPSYKDGVEEITIEPIEVRVIWDADSNPAIYTLEERENAKKNAKRYSWANDIVKAARKKADSYLEYVDALYNMAVPEGIPRYYHIGHKYDPQKFNCRYCGEDLSVEYGSYCWTTKPLVAEWKVECPKCKRLFPSNDFASFYELGRTESGVYWNYEQALMEHHKLFVCENGENCSCTDAPHPIDERMSEVWKEFYGFGKGYLANELYKEMDEKLGVVGWGVDDSRGYMQPYIADKELPGYDAKYYNKDGFAWYRDGTTEGPVQHTYVAYYAHEGVWYNHSGVSVIRDALYNFTTAFVYTGDAKYGRAGAILLDKIADLYPYFDWYQWAEFRGDKYRGKIVDPVSSNGLSRYFSNAYDAFLPIYNDPYVASYLSKNGARYEIDEIGNWKRDEDGNPIPINLKDTPGALRKNVEDNILIQIFDDVRRGKLWGNFGMHHAAVANAAVALNRAPESIEMLEWLNKYGVGYNSGAEANELISGGSMPQYFVEEVDRDGNGNENSPNYNAGWLTNLIYMAELLADYELYSEADLFSNPKFVKMFYAQVPLTLGGYYTAQTGDSGAVASTDLKLTTDYLLLAFKQLGDRKLAQAIHFANGGTTDGLHGSIYDADAEGVIKDIDRIVEESGALNLESEMLTGYGFAALRDGKKYDSAGSDTTSNTVRDFAMYFGGNTNHGHFDALNLYMSAFGLNLAPDLGYPEQTGSQPNRMEWVRTTLSHNTVVVNEKEHNGNDYVETPHHFDDSGRVKLMDISADVYEETEEYRRSVFMVEVNDEISYGVDFFHIKGGTDHLYSFHSQSDELSAISGLSDASGWETYEAQDGSLVGTYAGADVAYGADPGGLNSGKYPRGYTWLKNIRTYDSIEKDFSVEFKVKDWNKVLDEKRDIRLRLTMLGDTAVDEVTFATGLPPKKQENANIGELEYLLVRREGQNLDTLFTTVLEPYDATDRYIKGIEKVSMVRDIASKPGLGDAYGAVKVTLDGRTDYIIYSTNTTADYVIDDKIQFRGFGGVVSLDDSGNVTYTYLNDGEKIGLVGENITECVAAYTGQIADFTTEFAKENYILWKPAAGQTADAEAIIGKHVYVENDGVQNAVYKIKNAYENDNGDVVLDIGDVSLIRSFVNTSKMELGYVYDVGIGQKLRIPLSDVKTSAPIFAPIDDKRATAGSTIKFSFKAESPSEREISIIGTSIPRGMQIDEKAQTITWKPDSSQIGKNHVAITANDGTMETTVHFYINVYGSTSGGGGSSASSKPVTPNVPEDKEEDKEKKPEVPEPPKDETSDVRFRDLGNHAWAADAINALADDGIIKGTSEDEFSPAAKITRGMLVTVLYRMEGEPATNRSIPFSDVDLGAYYGNAVIWAKQNGIVNGVTENEFAPDANLAREQFATIIHRYASFKEYDVSVGENTNILSYNDAESISEYAIGAMQYTVGSGLIKGKTESTLNPKDTATRAEMAVIIKRFLDLTAEEK